jgi:hypothetical protein
MDTMKARAAASSRGKKTAQQKGDPRSGKYLAECTCVSDLEAAKLESL